MPRVTSSKPKNATSISASQQWLAEIDDHVNVLAWSPNNLWLAAASVSGPITIFDGRTGQILHHFAGHGFGTSDLAWNAQSTCLASAGQDGKVRFWEVETGQ